MNKTRGGKVNRAMSNAKKPTLLAGFLYFSTAEKFLTRTLLAVAFVGRSVWTSV